MKKYLIFLMPILLLVASCTKNDSENLKATLKFEGIVYDYETGEPIPEVAVQLLSEDSENSIVYSDEKGYFSLGVFNTGSYMIKYTKESYLNVMRGIAALNYDMTIAQEQTITLTAPMFPLTETASTMVVSRVTYDAISLPLANAPYKIQLGYFNEPIEGTTDEYGKLSVSGLPKGTQLSITFDFEREGLQYNNSYGFYLPYNTLPKILTLVPDMDDTPLVITGTNLVDTRGIPLKNYNPDENIIINFNLPIDTESIYSNSIEVGYGWNVQITDTTWTNNNQQLELVVSGLEFNSNYYLQVNLQSLTDFPQQLSTRIDFRTKSQ